MWIQVLYEGKHLRFRFNEKPSALNNDSDVNLYFILQNTDPGSIYSNCLIVNFVSVMKNYTLLLVCSWMLKKKCAVNSI